MENRFEALTLRQILAGLKHNLNTPLNLILGYAQQLQGSYPENPGLQKIIDAGLKIDKQLTDCRDEVQARLFQDSETFDLCAWLQAELSFLYCDLQIKRGIVFETQALPETLLISCSRPLLSLTFETIILSILEFKSGSAVRIHFRISPETAETCLRISSEPALKLSNPELADLVNQRLDQALNSWGISNREDCLKPEAGCVQDETALKLIIRQGND